MGIRGLLLYCKNYAADITEPYDLVDVAKGGEIEIIIDFYAFEYWILQQASVLLSANQANPWVELSGGEYAVTNSICSSMVLLLKNAGIKTTFVMDGAKFSSSAQADFKFNEWIRRDINDYTRVKQMMEMVDGYAPLGSLKRRDYVRPVLVELEIIRCLRDLGVEIHCCCSGEADMLIAKLFADRQAFGIVTNDSDFLLFDNCHSIYIDDNFDLDCHLREQLSEAYYNGLDSVKLCRLKVNMFNSTKVHKSLRLSNMDLVCDFAFIRGNDASKYFVDSVHKAIGISPNDFDKLVDFVRDNQPLLSVPEIKSLSKSIKGFTKAYFITHAFYKLNFSMMPSDEENIIDRELEEYICVGVSCLRLPSNMLSMSRGFHWCRIIVELIKFNAACPVSEVAMTPFRSFLYQMAVSRRLDGGSATEFCVLPKVGMQRTKLQVPEESWLPKLNHVHLLSKKERLELFHRVLTHQEDIYKPNYSGSKAFLDFPWPEAFCVYVCRYFLLLNFRHNLHLTREEILSVIACVFSTKSNSMIVAHSIPCRPSPRSLTVAAWLQNVYRYAGGFLAPMLDLASDIPSPSAFFAGSVFTAFYYCDEADKSSTSNGSAIRRIVNIKSEILRNHVRAVNNILCNCY